MPKGKRYGGRRVHGLGDDITPEGRGFSTSSRAAVKIVQESRTKNIERQRVLKGAFSKLLYMAIILNIILIALPIDTRQAISASREACGLPPDDLTDIPTHFDEHPEPLHIETLQEDEEDEALEISHEGGERAHHLREVYAEFSSTNRCVLEPYDAFPRHLTYCTS